MAAPAKIDRQTTTPFLLRLFYQKGSFQHLEDFASSRLPQHLQIYTWPNCTLSELTNLLLTTLPSLLPPQYAGTRIAFRLVYADMQGPQRPGMTPRYIARDLGSVIVGAQGVDDLSRDRDRDRDADTEAERGEEGGVKDALKQLNGELNKTLHDARFVIGDYVCAAILPPLADGSVAAAPPPAVGLMARGPPPRDPYAREGGFGRGGPRGENGYGGRGDYGGPGFGRGGRGGGGRFEDRRGPSVPSGEWRRGEAPPERDGYWRGGGGGGPRRGRGRGGW